MGIEPTTRSLGSFRPWTVPAGISAGTEDVMVSPSPALVASSRAIPPELDGGVGPLSPDGELDFRGADTRQEYLRQMQIPAPTSLPLTHKSISKKSAQTASTSDPATAYLLCRNGLLFEKMERFAFADVERPANRLGTPKQIKIVRFHELSPTRRALACTGPCFVLSEARKWVSVRKRKSYESTTSKSIPSLVFPKVSRLPTVGSCCVHVAWIRRKLRNR